MKHKRVVTDRPPAPLNRLEGRATSHGALRVVRVTPGRFPEETDAAVVAGRDELPVIRLKYFAGRRSAAVPPWIEAAVVRDDEAFAGELIAALAELLPPGGRLMIVYGDDETERGLKRRFPPPVTPIGTALVAAGCTWFKDWYFPEGWLEGEFKLQGNKPASEEAARAQLAELRADVEAWLTVVAGEEDELVARARERARAFF